MYLQSHPNYEEWLRLGQYFEALRFGYVGGGDTSWVYIKDDWQIKLDIGGKIHLWHRNIQVAPGRIWHREIALDDYQQAIPLLEAASHPVQDAINKLENDHGPALSRRGSDNVLILEFPRKHRFQIDEAGQITEVH